MKKTLLSILLSAIAFSINAQQLYNLTKGEITFFSKTPVEDISAKNVKPASLINLATLDIVVQMQIVHFKFPNSLMEEHFNENYMESAKYPKANFTGKINENIDYTKDGAYKITATGKLTIHGVTKNVTLTGTLTKKGTNLTLISEFDVALADYNIEIPSIVFQKIAEKIKVHANMIYDQKK